MKGKDVCKKQLLMPLIHAKYTSNTHAIVQVVTVISIYHTARNKAPWRLHAELVMSFLQLCIPICLNINADIM